MSKFIEWLVYSSENAEKFSLTIKGLTAFVPSVVIMLSLLKIDIAPDTLVGVISQIGFIVATLGTLATGLVSLFGLARKLQTTVSGTNAVVRGFRSRD